MADLNAWKAAAERALSRAGATEKLAFQRIATPRDGHGFVKVTYHGTSEQFRGFEVKIEGGGSFPTRRDEDELAEAIELRYED